MKKFNLSKAIIPNSFTAANLLCGFFSLIYAMNNDFNMAAVLILIGAVFDAVDGLVARLVGTSSVFGVELDSIADVVTFGVAPGFLIYSTFLKALGFYGIIISALIPLFGAFRLARFNTQIEDLNIKIDFRGLPIPTTAIIISTFVLSFYSANIEPRKYLFVVIPVIIILSLLMISNVRYDSLPTLGKKHIRIKWFYFILFILVIVLGLLTINELLLYIFGGFVLFGLFRQVIFFLFPSKFKIENNSKGD